MFCLKTRIHVNNDTTYGRVGFCTEIDDVSNFSILDDVSVSLLEKKISESFLSDAMLPLPLAELKLL